MGKRQKTGGGEEPRMGSGRVGGHGASQKIRQVTDSHSRAGLDEVDSHLWLMAVKMNFCYH